MVLSALGFGIAFFHKDLVQELLASALLAKVVSNRWNRENHPSKEDSTQVTRLLDQASASLHLVMLSLSSTSQPAEK